MMTMTTTTMTMVGILIVMSEIRATSHTYDPLKDIACWTCLNSRSNDDCNSMAPFSPCPKGSEACKNIYHYSEDRKVSVNVTKVCATSEDCKHLGCHPSVDGKVKVCSTCCDFTMCNQMLATDPTMASKLTYFKSTSIVSVTNHLVFFMTAVVFILCSFEFKYY